MTTPESLAPLVAERLAAVRAQVARAAARAGRPASSVSLIAVSKTFESEYVRAAHAAGQLAFGENRVQEALQKIAQTTELPIEWHLIGHLQSNKARKAVGPFTLIHSVDSLGLLERIDAAASEQQLVQRVLVQVDLAQEATKFGAPVDEVRAMLRAAPRLSHVRIDGLMLIPPACDDPEAARPWFTQLRQLRDGFVAAGLAGTGLPELSMGMSHDVEVAIEEGSTLVRVGSAIFGSRT
ncbi:MAG: YggS family pyridoxal phosphate-dependent enzyme [Acidobacteria bacterium]|nr:YggS family pyridoxal phosphate-dependent enzyme [Acidobacteriota bacterium]